VVVVQRRLRFALEQGGEAALGQRVGRPDE
jgi:hypothetical protein